VIADVQVSWDLNRFWLTAMTVATLFADIYLHTGQFTWPLRPLRTALPMDLRVQRNQAPPKFPVILPLPIVDLAMSFSESFSGAP
jgi:hypothetical protein